MKERTIVNRMIAACCALAAGIAAVCAFSTCDAVADATDSASGSIAIAYSHNSSESGTTIADADISLYKIGKVSSGANFKPIAPFTNSITYPFDWSTLTDKDAKVYRDAANTLAGLIALNRPEATQTGITNTTGNLTFSNVEDGLYLIIAGAVENDEYRCESANMLIAVPENGLTGGKRALNIEPKAECSMNSPATIQREVRKVWNDRNNSDGKRPDEVTVTLLRDGETYETVTLNASNGWKHQWNGLTDGHTWVIVETDVPDSYTMSVDQENKTTTITNSHTPQQPPHTGSNIEQVARIAVASLGGGIILLLLARGVRGTRDGKRSDMAGDK